MGKLTEALRARQQALAEHDQNPPVQSYEEDPVAGHRWYQRRIDLEYLNVQAEEQLAAAVGGLTREQRQQFFQQAFNDDFLERNGRFGLQDVIRETKKRGVKALREFFSDEANLGAPLAQIVERMESKLNEMQRRQIAGKLNSRSSLAERAAVICMNSDNSVTDTFYQILPEQVRQKYSAEMMEQNLREGKLGRILTRNANYRDNKTWLDGVGELEQIMGPEKSGEVADRINALRPLRVSENRLYRPFAGRLHELWSSVKQSDPRREWKQNLLNEIGNILVYPTENYLEQLDELDRKKIGLSRGPDAANSALAQAAIQEFLQDFQGGRFLDKLPYEHSNYLERRHYQPGLVEPVYQAKNGKQLGVTLTEEEQRQLREAGQGPIPAQVRDAMLSIYGNIQQLGEKNYWNNEVVKATAWKGNEPEKVEYFNEQGEKNYAFWPLVTAKRRLERAVREGNWENMQQAAAEYMRCKQITDQMMQTSRNVTGLPTYPGNLNSTRPVRNGLNGMPAEYLEDFAAHSRVNGAFFLHIIEKNYGIPPKEFLDNPGGTLIQTAENYRGSRLLSSHMKKPLGAQLALSFDHDLMAEAKSGWNLMVSAICRGMDTIGSMMPDKESRVRFEGQSYSAACAAQYEINKELRPWVNLVDSGREKRQLLTELAMVLPEGEFDLLDAGLKLGKNDWKQTLDPVQAMNRLAAEGRLDYKQIIDRAARIAGEAIEQEKALQNSTDPAQNENVAAYRGAFRNVCSRLLEHAPEEQREELRQSIISSELKHDPALKAVSAGLGRQMQTLEKQKSGWFLSAKNSPEHVEMMKRLRLVKRKLADLAGDPKALNGVRQDIVEKFRQKDLRSFIAEAKKACYHYAFEKTKGGTSAILHEAGMERNGAAMNSLRLLGQVEDRLGLRSPARKLLDTVCESALDGRVAKYWVRENCERHAAAAIAALSLEHKDIPHEKQKELLKSEKLEPALKKIMEQPAFRQMVKNEGLEGLAEKLVQGPSALTDAYMKAVRQAEEPQAQGEAPQSSAEQKKEFWAKRESPIQELGAAI